MLFKDLKQLGRGRKNTTDDESVVADTATPASSERGSDAENNTANGSADTVTHEVQKDTAKGSDETTVAENDSASAKPPIANEFNDMNEEQTVSASNAETEQSADSPAETGADEKVAKAAGSADNGTPDDAADVFESQEADEGESNEDLVEKMEKYREDYVRAVAELQNVKRRAEGDVSKAKKYGAESMARGLLDVKDSLDLARSVDLSDAREDAVSKMQEGLELTLKQLETVLEKHGVKPVTPEMGDKLDPELHQAMSMQPSSTVKANHVLAVVQTGYQLHDRLLRAAMVVVATAEDKAEPAEEASNSADSDTKGADS